MALFDANTRKYIESLIDNVDAQVRTDFAMQYVADENDYTSNLTSQIRRFINTNLYPLRATTFSQKLPSFHGHAWGVDACMVLVDHNVRKAKICLFKAKTSRNGWDHHKPNHTPKISHFSSQLTRQTNPNRHGYAVWEQFYVDVCNGIPVGKRSLTGSTCIFHDYAIRHNAPHPGEAVWTNTDIDILCTRQLQNKEPITMGGVVRTVCEDKKGDPISIDELHTRLEEIKFQHMLFIEGGERIVEDDTFKSIGEQFIANK